jgi:cytochrome c oxidase assembly protein subunit 15
MTPPDHRQRLLRRMATLCAALMLATIGLSAYMRLWSAGLGCADWPACYGQALRELQQGSAAVAAARLAHRIVASLALILSMLLVLSSLATRPVLRRDAALAVPLLMLALALAALGIVTPGARVPVVAMGNLLGGFVMLALCWRLAAPPAAAGLRAWGVAGLVVLIVQVALGALVSASYSALSCADFADCTRALRTGGWDWQALNPWRVPVFDLSLPIHRAGALAQWVHRVGAIVAVATLLLLGVLAWRHGRRREAAALLALTALQGALGPTLAGAGLPIALVLAHNLVAALLLAALARLV